MLKTSPSFTTTVIISVVIALIYAAALRLGYSESWVGTAVVKRRLTFFDPSNLPKVGPTPLYFRLEFVHIPKTAGTAISRSAFQSAHKINWGICHVSKSNDIGCQQPDWAHFHYQPSRSRRQRRLYPHSGNNDNNNANHTSVSSNSLWIGFRGQKFVGQLWHAPPHWIHPSTPYLGADTFCVIRNPYDRVISEYHGMLDDTHVGLGPTKSSLARYTNLNNNNGRDPREMNQWIQLKLREILKIDYFPDHFLPQHYYVYNEHRQQVMTHVLRFENLTQEFHHLVQRYDLQITLPERDQGSRHGTARKWTKEFLSPSTIALINQIYAADFQIFGYRMVTRPSQFKNNEQEKPARKSVQQKRASRQKANKAIVNAGRLSAKNSTVSRRQQEQRQQEQRQQGQQQGPLDRVQTVIEQQRHIEQAHTAAQEMLQHRIQQQQQQQQPGKPQDTNVLRELLHQSQEAAKNAKQLRQAHEAARTSLLTKTTTHSQMQTAPS